MLKTPSEFKIQESEWASDRNEKKKQTAWLVHPDEAEFPQLL